MSSRLADRLSLARHRRFAGRAAERTLFQAALSATDLPFYILYLFGPAGVGKTSLLGEFAYLCDEANIPSLRLDARNIEPAPESFLTALQAAMDLAPPESPLQHVVEWPQRQVILLDTYEKLAPLESWLREFFLPQLPEDVLVVIAGQYPLAPAWAADSGWQSLIGCCRCATLAPKRAGLIWLNETFQRNSIKLF